MNKAELIDAYASKTGSTKVAAEEAVKTLIGIFSDTISKCEEISLIGFGSFKVKDVAARKGRNPQTGEVIKIAASKRISFTAGKTLKDAVNSSKKKKPTTVDAAKKSKKC